MMSACGECGRCPCYEHERRTVYTSPEIPPPPRLPTFPPRPSAGGATIPVLVAFYLGALTVLVCVYLSSP